MWVLYPKNISIYNWYIDVYYLHWPDRKIGLFADSFGYEHQEDPGAIPIEETLSILDGFQKAGKIRHIAVSNGK